MGKRYYAVIENFDNGMSYDDHWETYSTLVICPTEELAKEYIEKYCVPEPTRYGRGSQWEEYIETREWEWQKGVRNFKRYSWCDDIELVWYTIETIDVYDGEEI